MPVDVEFHDVSKRYLVPAPPASAPGAEWLSALRRWLAPQRVPFWALRNVSFSVRRGETLGIIGANGAGKSTILKLLSEITTPTEGEIRLYGRVAALIEIGSGFHPELTGRENVFLSGTLLGMRRREIDAKLDAIVDFAGIGSFLDTPVKWYSSGMYVRLGFAIAAHLDAEILLVDEVLAVGDEAFQARCLERVHELRRSGATIILISHDLAAVEHVCERVLLIDRGRVGAEGEPASVIREYRRRLSAATHPDRDARVSGDALDRCVHV
jgi:ABC-type polysaccharide/polyol phosphate transport system ATPase subunit